MSASSPRSLAVALLAFWCLTLPARARLGEDEAALKKRFGEGRVLAPDARPADGHGLWGLFDTVMVFEKSGLVITAGLAAGKCEVIVYEPKVEEGKKAIPIAWVDVLTLLAKNAGESEFVERGWDGSNRWYERADKGGVAQVFGTYPVGATKVLVASASVFASQDDLREGKVRTELLKKHPSQRLTDF